jgi:acyl-CoA thioester hydrolase
MVDIDMNSYLKGEALYMPVRVYYADTDAEGVVYYGNYLAFAERARTEYLRAINFEQQSNYEKTKSGFMIKNCNINYISSAKVDDIIIIKTWVKSYKAASILIQQEMYVDDKLINAMEIQSVYVNFEKHKPCKLPNMLTEKLRNLTTIEK